MAHINPIGHNHKVSTQTHNCDSYYGNPKCPTSLGTLDPYMQAQHSPKKPYLLWSLGPKTFKHESYRTLEIMKDKDPTFWFSRLSLCLT